MFVLSLDPMENMPKVPVAGMENTQGHWVPSYGGEAGSGRRSGVILAIDPSIQPLQAKGRHEITLRRALGSP
jgi:hypothetical protein